VGKTHGKKAKKHVPALKGLDNMLKSGKPTLVNPARLDPLGPMQSAGCTCGYSQQAPFGADPSVLKTRQRRQATEMPVRFRA
jgi:hypothetical protein